MTIDLIDLVWYTMTDSEVYTPNDLANRSAHSADTILRVLEFLTRYGFIERITKHEQIYRKSASVPSPGDALRTLQTIVQALQRHDEAKDTRVRIEAPQGMLRNSAETASFKK